MNCIHGKDKQEYCDKCNLGVPKITIDVKGGVVQEVTIPFEEPKIKVVLRDYDADEEIEGRTKYDSEGDLYEEGIWEN